MKLSIIIPVYNEESTIGKVLETISNIDLGNWKKELIVINDGSTDSTTRIISNFTSDNRLSATNYKVVHHKKNYGKGTAVRTGIKNANGDYILIQDADLEYSPKFIPLLLKPIEKGATKIVFGTRLKRFPNVFSEERNLLFLIHYFGNRFLSLLTSVFYGTWLTDIETGYKLVSKNLLKDINLNSKGFEFEAEITSKLLKKGYKIQEVRISTQPRSHEQGKKLNTIRDGVKAFLTLVKQRFFS